MPANKTEQRALSMLRTFEHAGKTVSRVTIDGRKIELVLAQDHSPDEFDKVDMRHGKT